MRTLKSIMERWEHPFSGNDSPRLVVAEHMDLVGSYPPNPSHIDHLREYKKSDGARSVNVHLLHDAGVDVERVFGPLAHVVKKLTPADVAAKKINDLQDVVRSYRTPRDMHVYSGVHKDVVSGILDYTHEGPAHLHLPAFTSTSIDPDVAMDFAQAMDLHGIRHVLKIHVPQGSHGVYMHQDNSGNLHTREKEFLLHNGTKLHVHPQPTEYFHPEMSGHSFYKIWHAKLVHDGVNPTRHINEDT